MVVDRPPGNNPLYYYHASTNAASNCSECFQNTLCSIHCNYNIRVTHRNGAIKHIFHESDPRRSSLNCSLFILSLHALALHLAVKILLQIFLYEDLGIIATTTSVSFVFPPECQQDRTLLRNQYY